MTHEVVNNESLNSGVSKFLFFKNPPSLWVSDCQEKHIDILKKSNKPLGGIQAAGAMIKDDNIIVDACGSTTLGLDQGNSNIVAEYIKKLPGINPENVIISKKNL